MGTHCGRGRATRRVRNNAAQCYICRLHCFWWHSQLAVQWIHSGTQGRLGSEAWHICSLEKFGANCCDGLPLVWQQCCLWCCCFNVGRFGHSHWLPNLHHWNGHRGERERHCARRVEGSWNKGQDLDGHRLGVACSCDWCLLVGWRLE